MVWGLRLKESIKVWSGETEGDDGEAEKDGVAVTKALLFSVHMGPWKVRDLPQTTEQASNRGRLEHWGRTAARAWGHGRLRCLSPGPRAPLPFQQPFFLSHRNMFSLPPPFLPSSSVWQAVCYILVPGTGKAACSSFRAPTHQTLLPLPSSLLFPASCLSSSSLSSEETWYFSIDSARP